MATVHVQTQGAVVRKVGERLVVTFNKEELEDIRLIDLEQLCLHGNVQLTAPAVSLLLRRGTDVVFFSSYGKYLGRLMQTGSRFARLRLAQLQLMADEQAALGIAREIVQGKLANQRTVMVRRAAQAGPGQQQVVSQAVRGIQAMQRAAAAAPSLDSLRGYEGKAGAYYFAAFRALLEQDLGFSQRAYHPPPDPVNALLSFGYTLLLKDVQAAVELVGLDPYLGFFHAPEDNRPSLALDVMEEFRPILVDPMVLELVNSRRLTADDFAPQEESGRGIWLKEEGRRLVLKRYEAHLAGGIYHPHAGQQTTYRRCLELQVREMARVIRGEQKVYRAFTVR